MFVFRSLSGYWYQQIPSSDKLQKYFEDLNRYHTALGHTGQEAQTEFDVFLQERLAEATLANRKNNTRTGQALEKAMRFIVFALALAGVSFIPYLASDLGRREIPPHMQIEGPVHIESATSMTHPDQQSHPKPQ